MTGTDKRPSTRRVKDQKRIPLSMRITPEIRERLVTEAAARGRSITQEAELRLEQSLSEDDQLVRSLRRIYGPQLAGLLLLIGEALGRAGPAMGFMKSPTIEGAEDWFDAPY